MRGGLGLVPILLGVVGVAGFAGGITGIVAAVVRWRREQRAALSHTSTTGRVVDRYLPSASSTSTDGPRYTIAFTTADGQDVRFVTDSVGLTPKKAGDTVDVLYNPAASDDAFVRGGGRASAYILAAGGVVFTIVGLLMALSAIDLAFR